MPKNILQKFRIHASPADVYEVFMDSRKHAAFTGSAARISRKPGGVVSTYDGYVEARNIELVPGSRIVQSWRATDWPAGAYSLITLELHSAGHGATTVTFQQFGIPDKAWRSIERGWKDHYWTPLAEWLAAQRR